MKKVYLTPKIRSLSIIDECTSLLADSSQKVAVGQDEGNFETEDNDYVINSKQHNRSLWDEE